MKYEVVWIAVAGLLGTLSRYALTGATYRLLAPRFPIGTVIVNLSGSFVIGVIMTLGFATAWIPQTARVAVSIGFLGAFTTFSTFSYETVKLLESRMWWNAALNISINVIGSIVACWLGIVFFPTVHRRAVGCAN